MTDREKLLALIQKAKDICANDYSDHTENEYIADTLLDNGVTFATDTNVGSKWISVDEELPEESGTYIAAAIDGHTTRVTFVKWQKRNKMWELTGARSYWKITHWMPLPDPPKEG